MSYEIELTDVALEDFQNLIDSLPTARRRDAIDAVEAALQRLAANPRLAQHEHLGRPSYRFNFISDGVRYHWGCTFLISQDEIQVSVTHIFRIPM